MLVEMEELNTCLLKDLESCGQEIDGIKHMESVRSEEGKSEKNEPPTTATDAVFSSDAANNYYNTYLMKDLESRGHERDGRKLFMRLGEGKSEKNELPTAATDAVFSSATANNYYQAIGYYKMKIGSNTSKNDDDLAIKSKSSNTNKDNDGLPIKNKSSNTNKDNDGLPIKNKSSNTNKNDSVGNSAKKSEENNGGKSKSKSWKGLKGDASVDNTTVKSEENSVGKSVYSGGKSVTSLQEIMNYVTKKGKEPAVVAEYLKTADKSTNKAENRHTKKLLAEAQEKNKFYMDIVKFLMKAEEAKRKEEEDQAAERKSKEEEKGSSEWEMDKYLVEDAMKRGGKTPEEIVEERKRQELVEQALEQEMNEFLVKDVRKKRGGKKAKEAKREKKEYKKALLKCPEKIIEKTVQETQTLTESAEPTLKIEEEIKVPSEREMNEQFIKDAMKQGAKTPAEIALHLLKIDEERKTQELVEQALTVCKSPKEIADYLMKAARENQIEDEAAEEQESSKELVSYVPNQEVIRPGVAENSLTKSGKDKGSQARPKGIFKRSVRSPVKSLECHLPDDGEMSTTSRATNQLKRTRSIDSAMSTECSIMTEIVNPNEDMDNSPRAVSQDKEMKSPTRTVSFAEGTKEISECKYEKQDSLKMTATDDAQSLINNPDDTPRSWGVQLISEETNEESQEITLGAFYAGCFEESHSAADDSSVRDVVEEEDKDVQKDGNCISEAEKDEDTISKAEEGEVEVKEGRKNSNRFGEVEKDEDSISEAEEGEEEVEEEDKQGQKDVNCIGEAEKCDDSFSEVEEEEEEEGQKNSNGIGKVEKGEDSISEVEECEVVYDESDSKSDEQDKAAKKTPLKSKLKRILTFKKKSLPKKVLNRKASKNSTKKIAKHEANSSDSSGATQSCSSNESISVEKKPVKKKIVEFNLEDGPDRPITSISIPEKDPAIYDEVTLPSVLRKKSKPNNLNEPLEEWFSDMSILDDDRTGVYSDYSGATTQYTIDPYAVLDEDQAEERCTCSANEVKDYTSEIGLIACEVLDFCSAKARKASTLLGFDSEGLSKSIDTTQAEVTDVESKKKKKIVGGDEADNIEICLAKVRENDSKEKKKSSKRLGLRNPSRYEI